MSKYYKGDIGTDVILDTAEDLTVAGATVTQIKAKKPDNTEVIWAGSIYDDTKVKYTIQDGDLDQAGEWRLQVYIETPDWKGRGDTVHWKISEHHQ